jgi:hypothetical protein
MMNTMGEPKQDATLYGMRFPLEPIATRQSRHAGLAVTDELRMQITAVMLAQPNLTYLGFNDPLHRNAMAPDQLLWARTYLATEDCARQVLTCLNVMDLTYGRKDGTALRIHRRSSYGLKHAVEHRVCSLGLQGHASYIANGAFIVAAIIDGWDPVLTWHGNPNCTFRRRSRR